MASQSRIAHYSYIKSATYFLQALAKKLIQEVRKESITSFALSQHRTLKFVASMIQATDLLNCLDYYFLILRYYYKRQKIFFGYLRIEKK